MSVCIVPGCAREGTGRIEAGLDLGLCDPHLAALQRTCKGKQQLEYARLAVRESARLAAAGRRRRSRRTPAPYLCPLGTHWHVGNQLVDGDGQVDPAARDAAAAVKTRLRPGQVYDLTDAWRPGRATRPPRGGGDWTLAATVGCAAPVSRPDSPAAHATEMEKHAKLTGRAP